LQSLISDLRDKFQMGLGIWVQEVLDKVAAGTEIGRLKFLERQTLFEAVVGIVVEWRSSEREMALAARKNRLVGKQGVLAGE